MGESFRSPLGGLEVESGGNWLRDTGVQRRSAAWDDQRIFPLTASCRPIPRGWANEGRVVSQRRSHCGGCALYTPSIYRGSIGSEPTSSPQQWARNAFFFLWTALLDGESRETDGKRREETGRIGSDPKPSGGRRRFRGRKNRRFGAKSKGGSGSPCSPLGLGPLIKIERRIREIEIRGAVSVTLRLVAILAVKVQRCTLVWMYMMMHRR